MIEFEISAIIDKKKRSLTVIVLLCSNFKKINWPSTKLYMDAFTDDNKLININKLVAANKNVIPSLIALHALSSCDSVPTMSGIIKPQALKTISKVCYTTSYGQNQLVSSKRI